MTTIEKLNKTNPSNAGGEGDFFHIEVLPKQNYKRFRMQSVGEKNGIKSVGGQRANGIWDTIKWIVSREIAHVEHGRLIADTQDAQELFDKIGFVPQQIADNRFGANATF